MEKLKDYLKQSLQVYKDQCVHEGRKNLTYTQLLADAEFFARKLKAGYKYGILCRSEMATATAILACIFADAIAVPISIRYGNKHIESIISNIKLSYVIDDNGVNSISEKKAESEDLSNVVAILCTSGTTGTPKGVMLTDENILHNIKAIQKYFKVNQNDRMLIVRSLFHAAALTGEFLFGLSVGADITFLGNSAIPLLAAKTIAEKKITVMCTTPTLLKNICISLSHQKDISLKTVAISGECLSLPIAEKIRAVMPHTDLYNVYGLTEASPRVAALMPEDFDRNPDSIGRPIDGVEVRIDNGELCVKGANVMKGYYMNPKETKKKIVDGWLYTGDAAEISDGLLYIRGRKDNMMIRAGMNIYPQEIEKVILQDNNVQEALAFEKDGEIHVKVIGTISEKDAFSLFRDNLPTYAIPDKIEFVDDIPKSVAGKLVRHG